MRKVKEVLRLRFVLGLQQNQIPVAVRSVKRPFIVIYRKLPLSHRAPDHDDRLRTGALQGTANRPLVRLDRGAHRTTEVVSQAVSRVAQ